MARIRSIKPEFWDSESVGKASLRARLLFIAMWNWADDYGIGDATPIRLIGFAFPNDELGVADFPPLREEISERFHVVFYKHEGRPYFYIPSWEKHQRTEKRAQQRIPLPNDIENVEITDVSIKVADSPTLSSGNSAAGTGEEGRRKKEEGKKEEGLSRKTDASDADFEAFWDAYDKKEGRKPALAKWRAAIKKPGVTPELLLKAAAEYVAYQRDDGKHPEFTKLATTWLNGEHWNDERAARQPRLATTKPSTTDARVSEAMALAQRVRERQHHNDQPRAIGQNQ